MYFSIFGFLISCSSSSSDEYSIYKEYINNTENNQEITYCDSDCIRLNYINYMDTGSWTSKLAPPGKTMLNPMIKINMTKANDFKYIYTQIDSAIAFAKTLGFYRAYYWASFVYFNDNELGHKKNVDNYLDTAKWIANADKYLRQNYFHGINTHPQKIKTFRIFENKLNELEYLQMLENDSVTYLVFYIHYIAEENNPKLKEYFNIYPTYGGRKVKDEEFWRKRQTKPYPRQQIY